MTKASRFVWFLALGLALLPASAGAEEHCPADQQPQQAGGKPADASSDSGRSDRPRFKWWVDERARTEIGITDQQSAEIEQIFQATLPKLRSRSAELSEMEKALSNLIRESAADVSVVAQQVERVENLRAEISTTRTIMLYRMNRVLNPDQRVRLREMHDRWERSRKKSSEPR